MTTVAVRRSTPRCAQRRVQRVHQHEAERRLGLGAAPVQRHRRYDGRGELVLHQQVADLGTVAVGDHHVDVLARRGRPPPPPRPRAAAIWSSGRARPSGVGHRVAAEGEQDPHGTVDLGVGRARRRDARSPVRGRRTPRTAAGLAARSAAVASTSYPSESSSSEPVSTTPYAASAASGETLRHTTSRTTRCGSRSSGLPQPPPPVVRIRITSPALTGSSSASASTARSFGPPGSMTTSNGLPGQPALHAPAGQDRPVGDRHEVRVLEHPDVLLVAEAPAELPGPAGVHRQAERSRRGAGSATR